MSVSAPVTRAGCTLFLGFAGRPRPWPLDREARSRLVRPSRENGEMWCISGHFEQQQLTWGTVEQGLRTKPCPQVTQEEQENIAIPDRPGERSSNLQKGGGLFARSTRVRSFARWCSFAPFARRMPCCILLILSGRGGGIQTPASCSQSSSGIYMLSTQVHRCQALTWFRGFCFRSQHQALDGQRDRLFAQFLTRHRKRPQLTVWGVFEDRD